MIVTIITPESVIFDAEAEALSVPGVDGEFQMLENHASVVSLLTQGKVKLKGVKELSDSQSHLFEKIEGGWAFSVSGGTLEFHENKAVVLVK